MRLINYIKFWLAITFPSLEDMLLTEAQRHRLSICRIRATMKAFGHDCSDMADEQIEEGCIKMADVIRASGITTQEASQAFTQLSRI